MTQATPKKSNSGIPFLTAGTPTNLNWRTVNDLINENRNMRSELLTLNKYVNELLNRRRGGSAYGHFRGEYVSTAIYAVDDMAVISSGTNAGSYVCVSNNPGSDNSPWLGGGYWIKLPSGNALGRWS